MYFTKINFFHESIYWRCKDSSKTQSALTSSDTEVEAEFVIEKRVQGKFPPQLPVPRETGRIVYMTERVGEKKEVWNIYSKDALYSPTTKPFAELEGNLAVSYLNWGWAIIC